IIVHFVVIYAIFRFVIEYFRNDNRGLFFNLLSSSQIISLILLAGAAVLWHRVRRKEDKDVSKTV
ncbi:MAG: prolipoprotein diacylglyceryl transferase, partial [Deltaproteobacteria bacterium]|nr:prolipoprotein diacylglyceryl transferase [Deltaproteobacteria bacterium]